ncbi:MAG: hypothetical protein OJF60_000754 [Burkholderiaceae bacterium]|jgi:transposase|nr:MAG: hypothetical protein OJF60_000754 [Burkholderiaceae bacterium]
MHAELVSFDAPAGSTRESIVADALATIAHWRANPDLIRKHYLVSADNRRLMGFYLWRSREAAERGHDAAWIAAAEARSGCKITISAYDLFLLLDNASATLARFDDE